MGSHEFNFKIRFGKNKHEKASRMLAEAQPNTNTYLEPKPTHIAPIVVTPAAVQEVVEESVVVEEPVVEKMVEYSGPSIPDESLVFETLEVTETPSEPVKADPNLNKPKPSFAPGYYVVLGAFEMRCSVTYSNL